MIKKINLKKYGLAYLEKESIFAWMESDIEKLINAYCNENIVPIFSMLDCTQQNIDRLLAVSYCQRCGWCCISYNKGVPVFENELRLISNHSKYSYDFLKSNTVMYKNAEGREVRYLPQPCMFYQKGECQIYNIRPFHCRIYPLGREQASNGKVYIGVDVHCNYGKSIYKGGIEIVKNLLRQRISIEYGLLKPLD